MLNWVEHNNKAIDYKKNDNCIDFKQWLINYEFGGKVELKSVPANWDQVCLQPLTQCPSGFRGFQGSMPYHSPIETKELVTCKPEKTILTIKFSSLQNYDKYKSLIPIVKNPRSEKTIGSIVSKPVQKSIKTSQLIYSKPKYSKLFVKLIGKYNMDKKDFFGNGAKDCVYDESLVEKTEEVNPYLHLIDAIDSTEIIDTSVYDITIEILESALDLDKNLDIIKQLVLPACKNKTLDSYLENASNMK